MKEQQRNYKRDNQTAKEAIEKENEFLKKEVIGKGVESDDEVDRKQNDQSNIERAQEK